MWPQVNWVQYLTTVYFPSMQCPPQMAQEYVLALNEFEVKQLQEYLKKFMQMDR
ncbi:hypothetical protein HMI54_007763 [Coelomomyces lativittatus]|nr:hypothetical protein HMI54_007763 [Coelomomyces lativittatus]